MLLTSSHVFDGQPLTTVLLDGRPVWVARDVGRVLGYSEDGKGLVQMLSSNWAEEFEQGTHVLRLEGEVLKDFDAVSSEGGEFSTSPRGGGRRSLLVLTEAGVWLACVLSRKETGRRLRRWLSTEVLPALRQTGTYEVPRAPALATERERRLAAKQRADGFRAAARLARLQGKGPKLEQWYEARAAAALAGEDLGDVLPVLEEPTWTTEQVASELSTDYGIHVSASVLGKVAKANGLRGSEKYGRLAEAARKHAEGSCEIWRWNRAGVTRLKETWVNWMLSRGESLRRDTEPPEGAEGGGGLN
jgi:prophage antirepressor-like protein